MEEKIIKVLNILYKISEEEKNKFIKIFSKFDKKIKEEILLALYKKLDSQKENFLKLKTKLNLSINTLEETFEEASQDKINLEF